MPGTPGPSRLKFLTITPHLAGNLSQLPIDLLNGLDSADLGPRLREISD
jgi:hypothetical protein